PHLSMTDVPDFDQQEMAQYNRLEQQQIQIQVDAIHNILSEDGAIKRRFLKHVIRTTMVYLAMAFLALLTLTVAFNHMPSPYHLMLSVAITMLHCLAITALAVYSPVINAVIMFGSIIALTNSSFSS